MVVAQLQKGGFQAVVQHAACGLTGKEFQMKKLTQDVAVALVVIVFLAVPFSCLIYRLAEKLVDSTRAGTGQKAIPFSV